MRVTGWSHFFVCADQGADYIPGLSTITNIANIILKYVGRLSGGESNRHYFVYLETKTVLDCFMKALPGINIIWAMKHPPKPRATSPFRCAQQGVALGQGDAMLTLARLYRDGSQDVQKNQSEAEYWFQRVVKSSDLGSLHTLSQEPGAEAFAVQALYDTHRRFVQEMSSWDEFPPYGRSCYDGALALLTRIACTASSDQHPIWSILESIAADIACRATTPSEGDDEWCMLVRVSAKQQKAREIIAKAFKSNANAAPELCSQFMRQWVRFDMTEEQPFPDPPEEQLVGKDRKLCDVSGYWLAELLARQVEDKQNNCYVQLLIDQLGIDGETYADRQFMGCQGFGVSVSKRRKVALPRLQRLADEGFIQAQTAIARLKSEEQWLYQWSQLLQRQEKEKQNFLRS